LASCTLGASLAALGCGSTASGTPLGLGAGLGEGEAGTSPEAGSPANDGQDDAGDAAPSGATDGAGGDTGTDAEPTGGDAGAGDASSPEGGAGGDAGASGCAGGKAGLASDATGSKTPVKGYGGVQFTASTQTQIVRLETTLAVPAKPPAMGTLFLWPGLEPLTQSKNFQPIGTGVLQPVLTWGGTCAPTAPNTYDNWWISAQYVNTYGNDPGFMGCLGGQGIDVAVGDALHITMWLEGTTWKQTVVDAQTGEMASYDIDMKGQAQDWAIFSIEQPTSVKPASDVVFTSTTLTFADSDPAACQPSVRGTDDYFASPVTSVDGAQCCVSRIILRSQGVAATTTNGP
jgi:hypothetical protein